MKFKKKNNGGFVVEVVIVSIIILIFGAALYFEDVIMSRKLHLKECKEMYVEYVAARDTDEFHMASLIELNNKILKFKKQHKKYTNVCTVDWSKVKYIEID